MPLIKARSSSIMDSVDLRGTPTAPTAIQTVNTTQLASTGYVRTAIADLIDSSPELLNTLNELAAALGDDPDFATTVTNSIATKVPLDGSVAMTGELILSGDPVNNLGAVTKQYVDTEISNQMIYSTDDVGEGSTNLYFTNERARSAVTISSDNTAVLDYDTVTGEFTYNHPNSDGILEGVTNQYFTNSRARSAISVSSDDGTIISYSSSTGVISFTTPDTDQIDEGSTNLYFTTARARDSISAGSNISYNSATGVISTTAAVSSVNSQTGDVVLDTDDVNEGSTNLYFLDSRARAAISLTTNDSNILSYNSSTGVLTFTKPNTDAIAEGSTNLYYTNARVRNAVSASGSLSYNSSTGVFSYTTPSTDGISEGSTNLYYTDTRARSSISTSGWQISYNSSTGVISMATPDTDDVGEGSTNLYFTNARARDAISVTDSGGDGSLSYNSSTGVITYTGPSATEVRAHLSVTDSGGDGSLTYNSSTGVFTYTGPSASEVRAHLSATTATGAQYNSTTGVISLSGIPNSSLTNSSVTVNGASVSLGGSTTLDTDDIGEGTTNLYYTDTRVRGAISVSGDLTYNAGTGVIGFALSNHNTDDLTEGSTNLYFTNTRARDAISVTDAGGDGSLSYNSTTGVITYTGPSASEVRAHLSATTASGISYNSSTGVFSLSSIPNSSLTNSSLTVNGTVISLGGSGTLDTDDIGEGTTNLYYTDARARGSLSVSDPSGSLSYNSTTGVFTMNVAAGVSSVNGETGAVILDTDDINEGSTNLYYLDSRARNAISVTDAGGDGSLSYNSSTGVITYTGPSATEVRAHLSAGTGVTYNSTTGEISIGQAVATTDNVTFNDLTVSGNLTVNGTTTTLNTATLDVEDLNITVAAGAVNATAANGAGLTVDGANATITYASATDSWNLNKDLDVDGDVTADNFNGNLSGNVTGTVSDISNHDTDDLTEGSTNLYYTDTRARNAISTSGWQISYNSSTGVITMATPDTDDVGEGTTNLYFTDARARSAISVTDSGGDGSLSYNSSTGVITYTGPSATEARAHFSATDAGGDGSFSYDSGTGVFTYTGPSASEVRAHLSATTASGISYNSSTGVFSLSAIPNSSLTNDSVTFNGVEVALGASGTLDTDDIGEGTTNLYYTDTRARGAISVSGDLTYNSSTGVVGFALSNHDTDDLSEGTTNLYYLDSRARASISVTDSGGDGSLSYNNTTGVLTYTGPSASEVRAHLSVTDSGGDGSLTYNSSTGVFTYTGPSATEVRAHLSATTATGVSYDSATGVISLSAIPNSSLTNDSLTFNGVEVALGASGTLDTDDIGEGTTNLYFTNTRARGAVSLTTDDVNLMSYNSTTGVFTFNTPDTDDVTEGSTNLYYTDTRVRAAISVSGDLTYNSGTGVIGFALANHDTNDLAEGTTNLYFTNTRARSAISLTTDNSDALSYNSTTGTFTFNLSTVNTDEISEGSSNLYFTTARARQSISAGSNITYNSTTGVISSTSAVDSVNGQTGVVTLDTDDVSEGSTNLYFTNTRARGAISLTTSDSGVLSYNSSTGVLTFTKPNTDGIAEGSTNLYYTDARADGRIAAASIGDLSDVDLTGLADGHTLVWSSTAGDFVPQDVTATFTSLNFTGDGTTTSFNTLVEISDIDNTQVYINGLLQAPTYSYSLSTTNGETSIVFDVAPENNDYIFVRVASTNVLSAEGVLTQDSTVDGGSF